MTRGMYGVAAALLALCIFLIDALSPIEGAVAVLYVLVVLIASMTSRRGDILIAGVGALALTIIAYFISHGLDNVASPALRAFVSVAAITIATLLAIQNQASTHALAEQANLLNLTHDMIFVRKHSGEITFWNHAAEEVYGWSSSEAIGRKADELLETRYPEDRDTVETTLMRTGRWEGTLEQRTRSGVPIVLDSRWSLQRDRLGQVMGVLETHTNITERNAAHAALVRSERRYRHMFDSTRIGVVQEDWSGIREELERHAALNGGRRVGHVSTIPGFMARARRLVRILDVNPAFLEMIGVEKTENFTQTIDDVLDTGDISFAEAIEAFVRGDPFYEGETELVRAGGSLVPVLFAITFPAINDDGNVLVFVVDISERKQAQDALNLAQSELAHAARVSTLGELTASIAHEVNQPLMAVVTNGEAGMRWLRRNPPDLHEVETAITRVITEGRRASDIVKRIRDFLKKAPAKQDELCLPALIEEAVALVEHELERAKVDVLVEVQGGLPRIRGDRIQFQQVLVNLMVNAGQAMADHPGRRAIFVEASRLGKDEVAIAIRDTGPGIPEDHLQRLFDPFFTTKQNGMGMGLAICRTTVEAHGGRLTVESTPGDGATFQLVLPTSQPGLP